MNIEAGLTYCAGSSDFYAELLIDLAVSGKKEELQAAYDNKDWKLYGIKVHALKGAAKTLGLERLRETAEELQTAAEQEDVETIEKKHGKAVSMLELLAECAKDIS